MIPPDHDASVHEAGLAHHEPGDRKVGTRRTLLAAGAFALAASRRVAPEWLEEAAASDGALGGAKGGRRCKNHRGRLRRRTHGHRKSRKNGEHPRGGGSDPTQNIAFIVRNYRPVAVQAQGWDMNPARDAFTLPSAWDWTTLAALPAAGPALPATKEFFGNSIQVAIRIGTNRMVYAINQGPRPFMNGELPDVVLGTGGWDSRGWNPRGVVRRESNPLDSGRSLSADGITVTRIDDSSGHLRFTVDVS